MKHRVLLGSLRWFLWMVVWLWARSLRVTRSGNAAFDALRRERKNYVIAFWHGSMFAGWFLHRPHNGERVSALVSQSKDGEYLSTVLERWGFAMVRGSSHIGGKDAMQLMTGVVAAGNSLAITPDGPRGPKRVMKMGAVRTAQRTGVPLVLAGIAMADKKHLRSWDAFEVPIPFSRIAVAYSEPVIVPAALAGPPLDEFKTHMEQRLNELTAEAERMLGIAVAGVTNA